MEQIFKKKKSFVPQKVNLEKIRKFINESLSQTSLSADDIFKMELAVDEACANIIMHNYRHSTEKTITIAVLGDEEKVSVVIKDTGEKFNPLDIRDPNLMKHIKEYRKHGLGIYLMRRLVDEIIYHHSRETGNKLELIKYLDIFELT